MNKVFQTIFSFFLVSLPYVSHSAETSSVPKYKPMTVALRTVEEATGMRFKGAQGIVTVRVTFVDGKPIEATVVEPSDSELLNKAAIQLPQILGISIPSKPEPFIADFPFEMVRDSSILLKEKKCDELTDDVTYFVKHHPDQTYSDMRIYKLTLGALTLAADYEQRLQIAKTFKESFSETVETCKLSPDGKFLDIIRNAIANKK